jgi:uncharacterized protein YraI
MAKFMEEKMKRNSTGLFCILLLAGMVSCASSKENLQLAAAAGAPATQERWINGTYVKNGAVDTGGAGGKLAVRTGPGLNYTQIDVLPSGQKVTALESKNGWIRISGSPASAVSAAAVVPAAAPADPKQWVNGEYIKNGMVDTGSSGGRLAVRAGPGVYYTQVGTLASGTKVSVTGTPLNGWVCLAPETPVTAAAPAEKTPAAPAKYTPAAAPAPVKTATLSPVPRPAPVPVRPPVDNLILNGDFSSASLALPTVAGDTTAELSGRWLRSVAAAWEIAPYGGNLGAYVRAAASRDAGRLLYVVSDAGRSRGSYVLRFDYLLTDPSDVLGVKVFVSNTDIRIGTDGGDFRMNSSQRPDDMIMLPASATWATYYLPVELGSGYNCIYVLFTGSGTGNTGIDNLSLSPRRR